jgi:hypothetical protein
MGCFLKGKGLPVCMNVIVTVTITSNATTAITSTTSAIEPLWLTYVGKFAPIIGALITAVVALYVARYNKRARDLILGFLFVALAAFLMWGIVSLLSIFFAWLIGFIASIASMVSAIAAAGIAYFNYRSRPILMKSVERHSDDLRTLASEWAEQLPLVIEPTEIRIPLNELDKLMKEIEKPRIPVEDRFLFSDLHNHIPEEMPILEHWRKYKMDLLSYDQKRFCLLSHIRNEILIRTGLPFDSEFEHGVSSHGVKAVYNMFLAHIVNGSKHWLRYGHDTTISSHRDKSTLNAHGEGLAIGSQEEIRKMQEMLVQMTRDMRKTLGIEEYYCWTKIAKELLSDKQSLDKSRSELLHEIRDFASLPLMPGECKYIRWATKGK